MHLWAQGEMVMLFLFHFVTTLLFVQLRKKNIDINIVIVFC